MMLVPVHYADLILGDGWRDDPAWESLATSGVALGVHGRVELDVDRVGGDRGVALREVLDSYVTATRRLAGAVEHSNPVGPWVITRRPLIRAAQQAGSRSAKRGDLEAELAALRLFTDTGQAVDALVGARVDTAALHVLGAETRTDDSNRTEVSLITEGCRDWPVALGGAPSVNEVERHFTLTANHAEWRDRAVRRLVRVDIDAVELLPDPAAFTARLSLAAV